MIQRFLELKSPNENRVYEKLSNVALKIERKENLYGDK